MSQFNDQDHPDRFTQNLPTTQPPDPFAELEESRPHVVRWLLAGAVVLIILGVVFSSYLMRGVDRGFAAYYQASAKRKFEKGDFAGASEDLDRAIESEPDDPTPYFMRGWCRYEEEMFEASLADFNKVIELSPNYSDGYYARGQVRMRLGRHRDAIDDFTIQIKETPPTRADPWNNRAYARALANVDLEEGLADAEKALAIAPDNGAYLDTRGYLHHLLGNNEAALADLDHAVERIADERKKNFDATEEAKKEGLPPEVAERMEREFEHSQAVIYYHRSLVHKALGNTEQAEADKKLADDLGYDPENGVQ